MNNLLFKDVVEPVRTLGFYQPFGTLMLHGKIETRWVRTGKRPPFPLGKYIFYTTQRPCNESNLLDWSGSEIMQRIDKTIITDDSARLNGYAIGYGTLTCVRPLTKDDEINSFVKFIGNKTELIGEVEVSKTQWALVFKDIHRLDPFIWDYGKQGVGFCPKSLTHKLHYH